MATTQDFIEYVCDQVKNTGAVRYKKMFGEYMVYVNDKPILLVCDNIVYVKILDCVKDLMVYAEKGSPYQNAKEHYILDIDNIDLSGKVISKLESVTAVPIKKR